MMLSSKLFGLICLLAAIYSTTCLQCYYCISASGSYCGRTFHESIVPTKTCSKHGHLCTKRESITPEDDITVRGCEASDFCRNLSKSYSCHTCDQDFCNSSSNMTPALSVITIAILVLAKYRL